MLFINPRMAELKNKVPLTERYGMAVKNRVTLPEKYIIDIAYREKDSEIVTDALAGITERCRAEILSDDIARHSPGKDPMNSPTRLIFAFSCFHDWSLCSR